MIDVSVDMGLTYRNVMILDMYKLCSILSKQKKKEEINLLPVVRLIEAIRYLTWC